MTAWGPFSFPTTLRVDNHNGKEDEERKQGNLAKNRGASDQNKGVSSRKCEIQRVACKINK